MILRELIERAVEIANLGAGGGSALTTPEDVAESQLALVFAGVSEACAGSGYKRSLLRRTNTITFANGVGTIPETVLTAYLCESMLTDAADTTQRYSWVSQFSELIRVYDQRIGYFTANESSLMVVQPLASYDPLNGLNGDLDLTTPCVIEMPAALTDSVVVRDELLDDLVAALATSLRLQPTVARAAR